MSYTGELKWYSVAADVLAAINASTTSQFGRVGVVPGLIAWDECDCGLLAIYVNQEYESDDWPMQKVTRDISQGCGAIYDAAELVIHVVQCAPTPEGQANAPTVESEDAAARIVQRDRYQVRKALKLWLCEAADTRMIEDYIVDTTIIQGPTGGCVGTETRFRVALTGE